MLRLTLYGGFRLVGADGTEIRLKSKKAKALLAYLALPLGKARSREELMALLWSDRGEAQARGSLRQVLTGLRKELGHRARDALCISDNAVSLNPDHVIVEDSDVEDELLAGFHLHDPAFEEWLRDERLRSEDERFQSGSSPPPRRLGKPAVAVIPFVNMSGDPEQQYFSDGITEDITTELSRFGLIDVLARQSTFVLRDRQEDMSQELRKLGAHYLVEGSVRKIGSRIRLTAQLIDSESHKQVWADRYDREMTDLFAIQDELVHAIVATLAGRLATAGQDRALRKPPDSLAAYDYYLRSLRHDRLYDAQNAAAGMKALERAIGLDPTFARAYGLLALFKMFAGWFGGSQEYASVEILDLAKTAVELDPTDGDCYAKLGAVHVDRNEYEQARYNLKTALSLNPHDSYTWAYYAWYLVTAGRPAEALDYLDRILAVDPHPPNWNWDIRAEALYDLNRYEEAAKVLESKTVRYHYNFGQLAACYGQLGRKADAAALWAKVLEINPSTKLSWIGDGLGYQHQTNRDHWRDGLLKAGLAD